MDIHHCKALEDAASGPYIEVRKVIDGSHLVSVSLAEGESLLTVQCPSAILAEQFGIREAERRGIETLNVLHGRPVIQDSKVTKCQMEYTKDR